MNPATVHDGIVKVLNTRLGRRTDLTVTAFPGARPSTSAASIEVWPDPGNFVEYWKSFGTDGQLELGVRVRVEIPGGDADTAGRLMADLLGTGSDAPNSIVDALRSDPTLGGVVDDIIPQTAEWDVDDESFNHIAWLPCRVLIQKAGAVV